MNRLCQIGVVKRIVTRENNSNIFAPDATWRRFPISRVTTFGEGCFRIQMQKPLEDLVGKKFNHLLVLKRDATRYGRARFWVCVCDCGKNVSVPTSRLNTKSSCGCVGKAKSIARSTIHGHYKNGKVSPTMITYISMLKRCNDSNHENYKYYGAKGIAVCQRWTESFENFLADMGERPLGTWIERKDNSLGYCQSNCKWATYKEQENHRSNNHLVTIGGDTKTVSQWSDKSGVGHGTIMSRIDRGWDNESAVFGKLKWGGQNRERETESRTVSPFIAEMGLKDS